MDRIVADLKRVLAGVAASAVLWAGIGCGGASPENTYRTFMQASQEGHWEQVYGLLAADSQAQIDAAVQAALSLEADSHHVDVTAEYGDLESAALFARLVDKHEALFRPFSVTGYEILNSWSQGREATLTVRFNEGLEQPTRLIQLLKEDEGWKIQLQPS